MIRLAERNDIRGVALMSLKFIEASTYPLGVNVDKILNLIEKYIKDAGKGNVLIVMTDIMDNPVGMIAGSVADCYFSDDKIAQEIVWWVDPAYRGSKDSIKLIKAYEVWAKQQGCRVAQLSMINHLKGDSIEKLYERLGFEKKETAFLKEFK